MQAHVRAVEKFTNFMSPVGLSISHYNNSQTRKQRQRFSNLTKPPNVTGNASSSSSNSNSNSDSDHDPNTTSNNPPTHHQCAVINLSTSNDADDIKQSDRLPLRENQWTREHLSLRHVRNRTLYHEQSNSVNTESMDRIIDKLLIYGYETSADIAKMQPWQLRVLKKEIPQIDVLFMTAYRMWGKQEYYDDSQNLTFRQYWDSAVWLQYNEIELIIKCFDAPRRTYQCMICGAKHGLNELDQVRWHIWLEHRDSTQLNAIMQSSKKHNHSKLECMPLPPLEKSQPTVISLLDDSSEDEIEKKQCSKYTNKARPYTSRRNMNNKKRRSRRLANKQQQQMLNSNNHKKVNSKSIQNPVIVNGCNNDDVHRRNDENEFNVVEVHASASPAFMPSVHANHQQNVVSANRSTFSLDTHGSMTSMEMEMEMGMEMDDDEYNWNVNNNERQRQMQINEDMDTDLQMDEFNMIGMDDFDHLGVFGALSRNSSNSMNNNELNLNSAFTDPSSFSFGQSTKKVNDHNAVEIIMLFFYVYILKQSVFVCLDDVRQRGVE